MNEWGSMKRAAQKQGLMHAYRWLRNEADWKLAFRVGGGFQQVQGRGLQVHELSIWVLVEVLIFKPPMLTVVLLNPNPDPVVVATF